MFSQLQRSSVECEGTGTASTEREDEMGVVRFKRGSLVVEMDERCRSVDIWRVGSRMSAHPTSEAEARWLRESAFPALELIRSFWEWANDTTRDFSKRTAARAGG